jgi:superfamily II DNA or RNA helicase
MNMTRLLQAAGVRRAVIPPVPQVLPADWAGPFLQTHLNGVPLTDALIEYQAEFLRLTLDSPAVWLKWATGAGKTWAAYLWAFSRTSGPRPRALVVCPKRVRAQWAHAATKVTTLRPHVLIGKTSQAIPDEAQLVIVNWEIIIDREADVTAWLSQGDSTLIVDESHSMIDYRRVEKILDASGNEVWVPVKSWSAAVKRASLQARRRVALTATPYSSSIADLWSQWDMLEDKAVGSSTDFAKRYAAAKPGSFGGLDTSGRSNTDELRTRATYIMHVVSKERMSKALPKVGYEQVRILKEFQDTSSHTLSLKYLQERAKEGKASLFEAKVQLASEMKRSWVVEYAVAEARAGRKIVIFTGRKKEVDKLLNAVRVALRKESDKILVVGSHGDTPTAEREAQRIQYSERKESAILIGTHDAWGESVDGLQSTDVAIMAMLPWTPLKLIQSIGRFTRVGQDRRVVIVFPIAEGTVDEHVSETLLARIETIAATLEGETDSLATAAALVNRDESLLDDIIDKFLEAP